MQNEILQYEQKQGHAKSVAGLHGHRRGVIRGSTAAPSGFIRNVGELLLMMVGLPLSLFAGDDALPQAGSSRLQADIETVRERVITSFLLEEPVVDAGNIASLVKNLKPDGLWEGVDYASRRKSNWPVYFNHFLPTATLTRALYAPGSPYRDDPQLKDAVARAVDAWLTHDWRNPNWWYNEIGAPLNLGPILLVMEDELTLEQKQKGIAILKRANPRRGTGANRSWLAQIAIYRGLLEKSSETIREGVRNIEASITMGQREGIQPDWSFHQHGNCLQSNGYAAPFLSMGTRVAAFTTGTAFAMDAERVDRLLGTALDGSQWMVYGPAQDYGANGRSITRPGESSAYLLPIVEVLLQLPSDRTDELQALKAHLQAPDAHPPLAGNRHFWHSDIMTHKRNGYYASARMYSTRVDNTDNPHNGEGLKNHYTADGCNFLFRDGMEYRDIFGAWDWQKVPGTTVVQDGDFRGSPRRKGETDFVGGASDGTYGLAAFDFKRGAKLKARKSWFFFDDEYVCLGAGITSPSDSTVFTTLNQCYLRGDTTVLTGADTTRTLPKGSHALSGPVAVHHDGVAYIVPAQADILLRNMPQTGKWSDVNRNAYAEPDEMTSDVFLLGINHGVKPDNARYAYIVCPGMSVEAMQNYAATPAVEILDNSTARQAVRHAGLGITQVVFYEAGRLLDNGRLLAAVDAPSILMTRAKKNGLQLTVADPTQKLKKIQVTLPGRFAGAGCRYNDTNGETTVTVALPTGGDAGKSVILELARS